MKRLPAKIFVIALLAILVLLSLRTPPSRLSGELSILMEPDGTGIWRKLISEFNSRTPGVRVRIVEGPPATNAREDLYSTSFLSGTSSFDIVYCDVIWVAKFAAAGWLRDLTSRLSQEDREDFLAMELSAGSYRGRLYRIPAFTDAGLLYYRKDLVPAPPRTFDELVEQARKYQTKERLGFLWQGKQYEGLITAYLEILWGFGGDWIDPEKRQTFLDEPAAVQALDFLKSTIGSISPPGVTGYIEEDTRLLFQSGRAVFLRNWPYVWTLMKRSNAPVAEKAAYAPMVHAPGQSSAATLGGWGFAISSYCPNPDGAWRFVDFITRREQLALVQQHMGRIPSRKSLQPAEFLPIAEIVRMRPAIPEYAQASDILQRWVSAALTGRVTCEKALREAARETRLLLKG
ncbi:MAG: ABC transporter substrate-binding protein [Acidobacteria bacterium]|nr:ABC transporter substrate-binding protein [Acidobacteriota bacterium]